MISQQKSHYLCEVYEGCLPYNSTLELNETLLWSNFEMSSYLGTLNLYLGI